MYRIAAFGTTITEEKYLTGWRRSLCQMVFRFLATVHMGLFRFTTKIKYHSSQDVSYEYYLGKDYRETYKPPQGNGVVPTIISNHVSIFDNHAMGAIFKGNACFAAASFIKNLPFIGTCCTAFGSVYISRAATKEKLEQAMDELTRRALLNEEKGIFPPSVIYPEGTTSNNICLMKFRRGAFFAMRQVQPVTLKYRFENVSPAIEAMDEFMLIMLMSMSLQKNVLEVNVLPPFQPNEYLLKTHRDKVKGKEDWEVFAWACRDIMAKVGKFGKSDIDFAQRIAAYNYLTKKSPTYEVSKEQVELLNKHKKEN